MQDSSYELVKRLYKDERGHPILLTPSQVRIFNIIAKKEVPRVQIMCFTRFGKSLVVALAALTRCATFPEKWAIVAGSKTKAQIIMDYVIQHIFDNDYTMAKFVRQKGEKDEEVRRHRNKSHITFNVGDGLIGELFIVSAKEAIGLGAPNIIEDEASLISDSDHSMAMRMLGDNPNDNFLCKIGNPFLRNHFLKSHLDPAYVKINIDCYQGIAEGRITQETIDENSIYDFFPVLFENKFPDANKIDEQGWQCLLTEDDIKIANQRIFEPYGEKKIGVDVARAGRDYNVWTLRGANYAKVLLKHHDNDLMSVVGTTIGFIQAEGVSPENVFIDDTGVGGGVTDRLKEQGYNITPVILGGRAGDQEKYINIRAELYAGNDGVANWIKRTGYLEPHEGWGESITIRYKKESSGKLKIESKEDMRKRGEHSPDVIDSLMLTFYVPKKEPIYYGLDPAAVLGAGGVGQFMEGIG
jgi:hypothetical protein